MNSDDLNNLLDQIREELAKTVAWPTIGILGLTPTALRLLESLESLGALESVCGIYVRDGTGSRGSIPIKTLTQLRQDAPRLLIVASDKDKEILVAQSVDYLTPNTRLLISGFSHFRFVDPLFDGEVAKALIPSLANGYPNSLIHLYQCLKNAARLGLKGVVAEFGMFKGGTTMLLSRFIELLGQSWKVYGFDTFSGFPARCSPLDMYAHPDCVFLDESLVRRMFQGRNVEIISGDIVETVSQIKGMPVVLAFVDTDNYTPASAVLDVIQDQVVPGGAIVFDHFTGRNRFLYTLGERIAAKRLLEDVRYFNLHDSGVFIRQR